MILEKEQLDETKMHKTKWRKKKSPSDMKARVCDYENTLENRCKNVMPD